MEDQREKSTSDLFDRDDNGVFLPTIRNKEIINGLIKKHNRNIEKVKEELGNELWIEYIQSTSIDPTPLVKPMARPLGQSGKSSYWGWAIIVGFIAFVCIWIYALFAWGLLFGLLFGWIPALIGGAVVGIVWPLAVIIVIVLILILINNAS